MITDTGLRELRSHSDGSSHLVVLRRCLVGPTPTFRGLPGIPIQRDPGTQGRTLTASCRQSRVLALADVCTKFLSAFWRATRDL